jgi:hypothetical protein
MAESSDAVVEKLQRARGELAAGKLSPAVGALGDVVHGTRDPELLRQARELAEQGLAQAGRFGKGPWKRVIAVADERLNEAS